MTYGLLTEFDLPDDDQPSLVYSVEVDNADPGAFQLLDLVGYPRREDNVDNGKEVWSLYFVDEGVDSVLGLIDRALLTIGRAWMRSNCRGNGGARNFWILQDFALDPAWTGSGQQGAWITSQE